MLSYLDHIGKAQAPDEEMEDLLLRRPLVPAEPGQIPGAGRSANAVARDQ